MLSKRYKALPNKRLKGNSKMKRVLILVLAAILIFAFAACANKDDENTATPTPAQSPTASPTMTGTPMGENGNNGTDTTPGNGEATGSMFTGTVSSINGKTIVVTPNEGEDILSSGDKIEVTIDTDHNFAVGDKVKVSYEGDVMDGRVTATKVEEM